MFKIIQLLTGHFLTTVKTRFVAKRSSCLLLCLKYLEMTIIMISLLHILPPVCLNTCLLIKLIAFKLVATNQSITIAEIKFQLINIIVYVRVI